VNQFLFQPILVSHFDWGYMSWTDQTGVIDWEHDSKLSFPVDLRFGKVLSASEKTLMSLAVGFYYTFNDGKDNVRPESNGDICQARMAQSLGCNLVSVFSVNSICICRPQRMRSQSARAPGSFRQLFRDSHRLLPSATHRPNRIHPGVKI